MVGKKLIPIAAVILGFSLTITAITFSVQWKRGIRPFSYKRRGKPSSGRVASPTYTSVSAARQLYEHRLQVARETHQQMRKRRISQHKAESQRGISWLRWPPERRVKRTQGRHILFFPTRFVASGLDRSTPPLSFTVVSTYPEDQATNVPLDTVISVTFSDSLDRYAALNIELFPTPSLLFGSAISPDGRTVSANVTLDSNTTYQLLVMAAVTPDSQWIEPQIAATFSTGPVIPTGSIYGQIACPFDPGVNLAFAAAFSAEMPGSEMPYRVTKITAPDGSYSIENLPSGHYFLLAVQDLNGDLRIDGEIDLMGFYDANSDGEPDPIFVPEGQAAGSFDFQLQALEVISSYPADSTLNVPTDTTVSVTFNLPVDYLDEDFELMISPQPIDKGPLSASPDGKTIYMPVILEDSTLYQLVVVGAKTPGEPSQMQVEPYFAYFSTGPSFPSATISGTVTFEDFTPWAAFAFLLPPDGEEEEFFNISKINLSDGSYTIINIPPGTYYLGFWASIPSSKEGIFALYPDSVVVSEGDTITGVDITMTLGADITLYGRITGSSGIPGVDIEAYNITEEQGFEGQSNFLGYYRMNVSEGLYDIYFYPPRLSRYLEKDTSNLNITTDIELNVTLETGYFIYGVVTDTSGTPIPGVRISVSERTTQDWIAETGTDDHGEYRVIVPPGTYDVAFYPWQSRYLDTLVTDVVVTADYQLNMVLQAGSLVDGIVTNEDLVPLEWVGVIAFDAGTWDFVTATATDENGYYGFGLPPGTYGIFYDPTWNYTEYLPYTVPNITVPPDTTIDVILQHGWTISGQVRDPEDNPVEDARVVAMDTLYNWVTDDWTDDGGNYLLIVPPGTYHIQVWPPPDSLLPTTLHYITVPPDTVLDIQLRYPQLWTVTGVVTDTSYSPMDSVRLEIRDERTFEINDTTITDTNGIYSVQLLDGSYSIIFRTGDWLFQGFPDQAALPPIIDVFSDTTFDFTLHQGQPLSGTVTDTSGNPVVGASLGFHDSVSKRWVSSFFTEIDGHYSAFLAPNTYLVNVLPPSFSNLFSLWVEVPFTGTETYDFTLESIPFHDVGNVVFSWGAGRYGLAWNDGGQGFQYPPGEANNHLYCSYLLIAENETHISEGRDFQPVSIPPYSVITPGTVSDQEGYTVFEDSQAPSPVGVTTTQHIYAYASPPDNDYVIVQLLIANNDPFPKNIVIGMYFDWDVGESSDDIGDYDAAHNLGYIYSSDAPDSIHVGTAVLNPGGATSYRVYDWSEGYLDYMDKYATLTEGFQQTSAGPGDVRYYIATGPFTLPPAGQDTLEVAFAILAGDNLSDLQANAEAAQTKYNTIVSVGAEVSSGVIPKVFSLSQNYPNPFNPETLIRFGLPKTSHVRLIIYNILGQKVKTLVDGKKEPGFYTIHWDGTDEHGNQVASGVYIYRIEAEGFINSKKLLLLR